MAAIYLLIDVVVSFITVIKSIIAVLVFNSVEPLRNFYATQRKQIKQMEKCLESWVVLSAEREAN